MDVHRNVYKSAVKRYGVTTDTGTVCAYHGVTIACDDPNLGWWNSTDGCYWNIVTPQPPASSPLWVGNLPGNGDLYTRTCETAQGLGVGVLGTNIAFSSVKPPGYDGQTGPVTAMLALQALLSTSLLGPVVHTAPAATGVGLVGLPVWMWQDATPLTWGPVDPPLTGSVSAGVRVHALGARVDWYMGDGTDVACKLGTPYPGAPGQTTSPTCGHTYLRSSASQPDGTYHVYAAATWNVSWTVAGASGALTIVRYTPLSLRIEQLQVVNE